MAVKQKKQRTKEVQVNFRVEENLLEKIREAAAKEERTQSQLIRLAIKHYLSVHYPSSVVGSAVNSE